MSSQAQSTCPIRAQSNATTAVSLTNATDPNTGITNTITLRDSNNTPTGTGTITFWVRKGSCFSGEIFQSPPVTVVNGSATFHFPATQIGSGQFWWSYHFQSTDPNCAGLATNCDVPSTIQKANTTLSLQANKLVATLGETVNLKATLGGTFQYSPEVTFFVSGPDASSCGQRTALATVPFGSDKTVTIPFQPTQPGNYVFTAEVPGNELNNSASVGCGSSAVTYYPALSITTPANVYAGQSFDITVIAYDGYPKVATNYNGTVHFTASNGAVLPGDATVTNGRGTFRATLNATGSQTITATDTINSFATATSTIYVYPQSTFVVTSSAGSDNGSCGSVCTLRDAINAANNQAGPATIIFNIPNMAGCSAANQCTIGLGAPLPAVNDDVAIDGSRNSAQITIEGNFQRILTVNGGKRATLTGLTLQGGAVGSSSSTGGAIHNDGTLYLADMTFRNNGANNHGGAIGNGGTGTLDITGCSFSNNVVTGNGTGGAIYNEGALTIRRSTFSQNRSQDNRGGAINHVGGAPMTISDSTFTGNQAPNAYGGAITKSGPITISNSTFLNNSTGGAGGAIFSSNASTVLANCTFYGNSAPGDGGGRGGAAFAFLSGGSSKQHITNCTFMNNVSGPSGFGAITNHTYPGDVIIRNVLMANNTGGNCSGAFPIDADASNMCDDTSCGSAQQASTSGFPADNGGPTQTIALDPGSQAIDAGNDATAAAPVGAPLYGAGGTDQRGAPRPQFAHADVGAYELAPQAVATVSATSYDIPVNSGPTNLFTLTSASAPPPGGDSYFIVDGVRNNSFDPTGMAVGNILTVTYRVFDVLNYSSSVTFTIRVVEAPSLVVTTAADSVSPIDSLTSLREALAYAQAPISTTGFGANGSGWTLNGPSASVNGSLGTLNDILTITPATQNQANTAWLNSKVNVNSFSVRFRYTQNAGASGADGFTFTLQNAGLSALGANGGGLGYGGIGQSVAFAFNIWGGLTRGFAVYQNGNVSGSYTAPGNGIDLTSGQPVDITITGTGTSVTLTMTQNANVFTTTFNNLDISSVVGGNTAYVGFTGGTGGTVARQQISQFNLTAAPITAATLTFAPALAGQTINLSAAGGNADGWANSSAFAVTGGITINGPTTSPGVTLAVDAAAILRHFVVRRGASLTLNNLTLANGKPQLASFNRGGAISAFGNLTARNCTFTGNTSPAEGGAIQNWPGAASFVLENCTFSGNSSGNQAAAFSANSTQAILRHLTITNNTAPNSAVVLWGTQGTMVNSIVTGNSNDTVLTGNGGTFTAQSTNNLLGATSATGLTNGSNNNQLGVPASQLFLGSLGNNGGPTQTLALQPGSLAIDAGATISGLATDQRGVARPNGSAVDIGAFELQQTQAAIPIVSPLGGTYDTSVQISIANTNTNATVRYTLDGTTPSSSNGQIYSAPVILTANTTVKAIAYGRGWIDSPVASVGYTLLAPLPFWRNLQGLPADGSQDFATPAGDGVANLVKFAFNMAPNAGDLARPNVSVLQPNGTAGLPYFEFDAQGRLTIQFVRRKASTDPGIAYIVETGSDLTNLMPLSLAGATVVSIDSTWERVTITDPTTSAKRFGRVRIQSLGVYFNDFNAALGAATLRGSAVYTNQAVRLTDTIASQVGAVIFDGITTGPQLTGFTAKFRLQLGPTTSNVPADGASFAVGDLGTSGWTEMGPTTSHHIAVGFDTYESGGNGSIGIHLWVNGTHIVANPTNPYTNGAMVPVEIAYQTGAITVKYNGAVIFDNVAVSGFSFLSTDKFGIGARTGGANERCVVDDIEIAPR